MNRKIYCKSDKKLEEAFRQYSEGKPIIDIDLGDSYISGHCFVRCHHDCYRWQCHCPCHGPRTLESIKSRRMAEENRRVDCMGIPIE